MKREKPGQVRVHRGFLKAESVEALWAEGTGIEKTCQIPQPTSYPV